jgi:hypothetical protein
MGLKLPIISVVSEVLPLDGALELLFLDQVMDVSIPQDHQVVFLVLAALLVDLAIH